MSWAFYARLRVIGVPKAQPRVKATKRGNHAGVYTPATAKSWKELISFESAPLAGRQIEGPIALRIHFALRRPKIRKKDIYVTTKPDIDNLLKSTMDALTDRAVWRDDALIAEISVKKTYETINAVPGAVIEIFTWRE